MKQNKIMKSYKIKTLTNSILALSITLLPWVTKAQEQVELDAVISAAVSQNFNVKIAKNNVAISATDATIGNAGFLPTVDFTGGYTYSNTITNTQFSNGIPDQTINGANSHSYNANVNLKYTLFDGLKPVYRLKQSKASLALSNTQYQQTIENTIYNVIQSYYNLASLQEDYRLAEEKLTLTKTQLQRVENKRKYGQGSEVERLNLLTTYNVDSTQLLRLQLNMRQAIRQLNKNIGSEMIKDGTKVRVNTDLDLELNYEAVKEAAMQNNLQLLQAQQNIDKAKLDYKLVKTELYPKLTTRISYGYNGSQNDAGIALANNSLGPSINLGLNYTIYGAGAVKRERLKNQLNIKNQELNLDLVKYELEQNIKDAYTKHENNMALIPLEESNVAISKQSFERTTAAYNLGQASYLDYQQAQYNYIQAQKQVIIAKYNAKLSEWELRRLSGRIAE